MREKKRWQNYGAQNQQKEKKEKKEKKETTCEQVQEAYQYDVGRRHIVRLYISVPLLLLLVPRRGGGGGRRRLSLYHT